MSHPDSPSDDSLIPILERIAAALDRLAPPPAPKVADIGTDAFVWRGPPWVLDPVPAVNRVSLDLLNGIDQQRDILLSNTLRFARGLPANNALLWGARGMGKSSLIKAVHAAVNETVQPSGRGARAKQTENGKLALIEIQREDIGTLPHLLAVLRPLNRRFLIFCDDLSFEADDKTFKSLKSVLDGGVEGRPSHVLFYATSNRRHLLPRDMIENERSRAIHGADVVDEKIALSDRFGLWLGFHACDQETFFAMVRDYARFHALPVDDDQLIAEAVEWSVTRGARSGRVAWQFIQDMAGRLGCHLN